MKISAIIPTKNRKEECIKCVESMLEQTVPFHEIIVVEGGRSNNSLVSSLNLLSQKSSSIIYIHSEESGLTLQRNIGIQKATGDAVFFTDDDTIIDRNCVESMINTYNQGDIDGVQPIVVEDYAPSFLSSVLRTIFLLTDQTSSKGPYMKPSGFPSLAGRQASDVPAEVFCGVASFKKKVYENVKFDENLVGYGAMEDVDLSYRASRRFNLMISAKAIVHHYPSPKNRDNLFNKHKMSTNHYWYLFGKNMKKNPVNVLAFAWANVGLLTMASINSMRWKTTSPIRGVLAAFVDSSMHKK